MWYSVLTVSGHGEIWLHGSGQAERVLPQPEVGYGEHEMKARHPESSYYQRSIVVQNRKRNLLLKKLTENSNFEACEEGTSVGLLGRMGCTSLEFK